MKGRRGNLRFVYIVVSTAAALLVACISPVVDETDTRYSEQESVWQYLEAYSIYQDSSIYKGRIPADPFVYSDPAKMMRAVGDTLYGEHYTLYGVMSFYPGGTGEFISGSGTSQLASSRSPDVLLDTLTDSTVRISIHSFTTGVTYKQFLDILLGVWPFPIVIVDLRGDGGGDIDETKSIIDAFIPKGKSYIMAREREYDDEKRAARTINWHAWETDSIARLELKDKRFTVLMDHNSASASEILIAALKDCADATLVGGRSFGKGIGQIKIFRRDRPGMQITFLQMRGVSDRIGEYHHRGIEPDVLASETEEEVLLTAIQVHEPSATRLRRLRKQAVSSTPIGAYRVVWE
ncbi:MAG: hypothetical protein JXA18_00855 [Chitinispirillaceae bacterium]|nr:hypothetical protein [Chitinispirillaceae bacterium]